jgi:hypothetical protein
MELDIGKVRPPQILAKAVLPSFLAGEVARRAGGVMSNDDDAHDPSVAV